MIDPKYTEFAWHSYALDFLKKTGIDLFPIMAMYRAIVTTTVFTEAAYGGRKNLDLLRMGIRIYLESYFGNLPEEGLRAWKQWRENSNLKELSEILRLESLMQKTSVFNRLSKNYFPTFQRAEVVFKEELIAALDRQINGNAAMSAKDIPADRAFYTSFHKKGGVDFTSNQALVVRNNGHAIQFHLDPAQLAQLQNAPGFVPVIINIQPVSDLRVWLGLNDQKPAGQTVG
jgi:hypothetical protein